MSSGKNSRPYSPSTFTCSIRNPLRDGFNKDSYGYIQAAEEPSRLLRQNEERQSRPLYVLLGTAVGYPLRAVLPHIVDEVAVRAAVGPDVPLSDRALIGFYPAFILLNFGVLLSALLLFVRLYYFLTDAPTDSLTRYCLLVFLASSPIVKAFFWTAHQQMFCFFTPLFCLWLLHWFRQHPPQPRQWRWWALLTGVLPLLYPAQGILLLVAALGCHAYQVLSYGPFS